MFSTFNSFKQFCKLGILKPDFKKTKLKKTRKSSAYFMPVQSSCSFFYVIFIKDALFHAMVQRDQRVRNYVSWTGDLHAPSPEIIDYGPPCSESHSLVALISADLQKLPKPKAAMERWTSDLYGD